MSWNYLILRLKSLNDVGFLGGFSLFDAAASLLSGVIEIWLCGG